MILGGGIIGGGQVSHLAKIKFNREPGCEEVCE